MTMILMIFTKLVAHKMIFVVDIWLTERHGTCPFQDHRFRAQTSKHHRGSADTEPNPEDDHYEDLDDLDDCVGGG